MITRRTFLRGTGGAVALAGGLGGYTVLVEPEFRLVAANWTVEHGSWPSAMPPLKIAVLTDLHAVDPWMSVSRITQIVETANALEPDLIVLLGDYVSGLPKYHTRIIPIAEWTQPLAKLRAPLGVYAILGNHDWWDDRRGVRDGIRAAGIPVLENHALKIDRNGQRFWLAGLGDQLAHPLGRGRYRGADNLDATIRQTMGDRDPVVLLAHEPDIFVRVPARVAVTLAGHTHGGQVLLPFIGRPILPGVNGKRFAYGHIVEGGRHMVVSSGLGLTGLPVRFGVPPEIAVVTVTAPGNVPTA